MKKKIKTWTLEDLRVGQDREDRHAVMNAYFSGRMDLPNLRIELTYGEETDMEGAREVLGTQSADDVVVVVDVTGADTDCDITIET